MGGNIPADLAFESARIRTEIEQRSVDDARRDLFTQRIRAMAKNYPLRLFLRAEVSKMALTLGAVKPFGSTANA